MCSRVLLAVFIRSAQSARETISGPTTLFPYPTLSRSMANGSFGIVCCRFCFGGDSEYIPGDDKFDPATPMDEVACYTSTSLPWLVATAATILVVNMVCAFAALVMTTTSLPPAIRLIISAKCIFGRNSNCEEDEQQKDESAEEDVDTVPKRMSGKIDIDPGSAMEGATGKGDQIVFMQAHLMKNLLWLLLVFGFAIALGMGIVWTKADESVRVEMILTMLAIMAGAFIVAVVLVVNASYGFGFKKLFFGKFFPHPSVWLKRKSDETVLTGMPRAYLALSGIIMLVCSGVMTAGDVIISNSPAYREVSHYTKGKNFYFAGCTIVFVPTACLGFALAMLTSKKHLKTFVACFFLASFAGLVASTYLNFRFGEGPYRFESMSFSIRLMLGHHHQQGNFIKGQDYPGVSAWLILKFVAAEIIMTFSFFNVLLAATFFVGLKGSCETSSSRIMGFQGIIMISLGLALEVVLNLLITSDIMISGYSWSLQEIRPIVAISTLLAGIHALHGFYSAGKLRKVTLFFLSVIVTASAVFAGIAVLRFRSEALEVETAAQTPCQSMDSDAGADSHFCVYNISEAYHQRYKKGGGWFISLDSKWHDQCMPMYVNKNFPPPLACVPKEKLCDGRADLFIDGVDWTGRYYRSSISKSKYDSTFLANMVQTNYYKL